VNDQAETERASLDSPQAGTPRTSGHKRWRAIVAIVLLVIGAVILPLAVTGAWVRDSIFDTNGFVDMMGPLAENPALQEAAAHSISVQLFERLELESQIEGLLPEGLGFLAGPATERLQSWTEVVALRITSSDRFPAIWTTALETFHSNVVAFIDGSGRLALGPNGRIELDLTGVAAGVTERLEERGIKIDNERLMGLGIIPIAQVKALNRVADLLNAVNKVFIVLPILVVLLFAGSVAVAQRRSKAIVRVGIGVMIATAVFIIALFIVRTVFLGAVEDAGFSRDAAGVLWGTLTIALRATSWGLFFLGLLMLIHPRVLTLLRGNRMTALATRSAESGREYGAAGRWVSAHRTLLAIGILVLGFLVLALWNTPPLFGVIVVAAIVIVLEGLVFFLAAQNDLTARGLADTAPEERRGVGEASDGPTEQ